MVVALLSACQGNLSGNRSVEDLTAAPRPDGVSLPTETSSTPSQPGGTSAPSSPLLCDDGEIHAGRAPIRRLTRFEYNNTVRDLFGDTTQPANSLPPEELGNGFGNDADTISVPGLLAEQYGVVAEGIAARATAPEALSRLAPCASAMTAATEAACLRTVIDNVAAQAFRRPLAAGESDDLFGLAQALGATPNATFATTVAGVIQAILQSPDFLYRVEFGVPDPVRPDLRRPTGDEMATRLSYFFWGTQPDESLRVAARTGELLGAEGIRAQATRMLDDPRSRTMIRFFFDNLLPISGLTDLQRDRALFPAFSSELGAAMHEETQRFLEYEIFEGGGTWPSALTAPYTFVNGPLANFYGMSGVTGNDFVKVPLDTSQRLGLLTQAGVMTGTITTNRSNPVLRASFILNRLMCRKISLPTDPAILALVQVPADTSGATARERFSKHSSQAVCRSCHQILDPIGFALENYDPIGQYRTQENGATIDASSVMPGSDETIVGGVELARWLADNGDAQDCFASHWVEFAYGETLRQDDACTRSAINVAFEESGYDVKELLLALTQTDQFLYYPGNP
jgi:Protein of unknown function (DUF1592)/Protein of unknown function (DUF1588)/Protein of unknown function (DUF1587)/Protein of unknown function (DUF1595)/Protein of unknown function (DUF1585)